MNYSDPLSAGYGLTGLWILSWMLAAVWTTRTRARPMFGSAFLYNLLTLVGFGMLFTQQGAADWRFPVDVQWGLVGAEAFGFAFCWWARLHLGRLWSGSVTRKEDHRIVDTGPYRLVRHPIYTGLIIAPFALALIKGTVVGLVGAALMTAGWWVKARLEEKFLREELGAADYDAYAARTPMLIPFWPTSRKFR